MNQVNWHRKNIDCSAETCCSLEFGYSCGSICGKKIKFGPFRTFQWQVFIPVKYLFIHE